MSGNYFDIREEPPSSKEPLRETQEKTTKQSEKSEPNPAISDLLNILSVIKIIGSSVHFLTKRFSVINLESASNSTERHSFLHANFSRTSPFAIFDKISKRLFFCGKNLSIAERSVLENSAQEQFGSSISVIDVDDDSWEEMKKEFSTLQLEAKKEHSEEINAFKKAGIKVPEHEDDDDEETDNKKLPKNISYAELLQRLQIACLKIASLDDSYEKAVEKKEDLKDAERIADIIRKEIDRMEKKEEILRQEIKHREELKTSFETHGPGI